MAPLNLLTGKTLGQLEKSCQKKRHKSLTCARSHLANYLIKGRSQNLVGSSLKSAINVIAVVKPAIGSLTINLKDNIPIFALLIVTSVLKWA